MDYAILMTSRFQEELQSGKNRKEAIRIAADSADASIITSALVMFCATLGVSFVSSIDLIGAICIMLARGALISACICLFVMPAVLYVCEPVFSKTTLHWRTPAPKKESKTAKALKAASGKLPARKEKAALPEKGTEPVSYTHLTKSTAVVSIRSRYIAPSPVIMAFSSYCFKMAVISSSWADTASVAGE